MSPPPGLTDDDPDSRLLWRMMAKSTRPWIGWVFIGIGALLILLGYFGVSREAIVEKQMPYVISGGLGGLLLCIVGAYFLGTEELRRDSGRLDRLESMVQELHGALLSRPDAPAPAATPATQATATNGNGNGKVLAVEGGESFHRDGCRLATGKQVEELTSAQAKRRGLRPCPLCEPNGQPVNAGSTA
jgi:hypothetical protein